MRATQAAAQRLAEEAARERAAGPRVPPAGWDIPRQAERAHDELDALVALLGTLRDVLAPDVRAALAELARQLLVFLRAVVDWAIARLDGPAPSPPPAPPVEDIALS